MNIHANSLSLLFTTNILLVALYRMTALWNARILSLRCSHFLFNTYRGYARLFVQGSDQVLLSKEGVTQGVLLSMMMYAVVVLPLIRSLEDSHQ